MLTVDAAVVSSAPRFEFGEVLTRRWVVDLILDLAGYTPDRDLASLRVVEPSFGRGAFVEAIVARLLDSAARHGHDPAGLNEAIYAVDLQAENVEHVTRSVIELLVDHGVPHATASSLALTWLRQGDYLLSNHEDESVDIVVGNPPYIRLEDIDNDVVSEYRARCRTMTGRADLYVGFFETGLGTLRKGGVLCFICADRWMRNQYGQGLRALVVGGYSADCVLTMHDVDAFESQVSAYPAITLIRRAPQGDVVVADASAQFGEAEALAFANAYTNVAASIEVPGAQVARLPSWFETDDPWPSGSPAVLALIEELDERFGTLEDLEGHTKVGIGIATGNDSVFITTDSGLVESDRLLPLMMRRDGRDSGVEWGGTYLVNPWNERGELVDLACFPRLCDYFKQHEAALRARHVGKKSPANWYRTIDKVNQSIIDQPKLLFPDMAASSRPTLEPGGLYPHHNLYWVTSDTWDLRVLGGLLMSRVGEAFIRAFCVKMRGGTLRFQAQYLRKICVPEPSTISGSQATALAEAFTKRDVAHATEIALAVYGVEHHAAAIR